MQSKVYTSKPQKAAKHRCPLYNFINSLTNDLKYIYILLLRWYVESQLATSWNIIWPKSDKVCDVT